MSLHLCFHPFMYDLFYFFPLFCFVFSFFSFIYSVVVVCCCTTMVCMEGLNGSLLEVIGETCSARFIRSEISDCRLTCFKSYITLLRQKSRATQKPERPT